ncbi:MAG: CRISPR-associated helicase Cas3', partial [Planktothrix sp.]
DIVSTFIDKPKACYRLIGATGVGKTLTSLNFALEHCQHHNMDGLIYVAPFKSIIDQTAKIYREKLGDDAVLEHHSDFVPKPKDENDYRLSCQRWDYPVIVTTAVQFFESIFSNKASRCRKLQGLLNKVILIDEYQTIPPNLIESISDVLNGLVEDYGCTVVLMSATAPNLTGFNLPHIDMIPQSEVNRQFEVLKRCEYEFKEFDYQEIVNYPGKKLMVVNTTRKAFEAFQYFDSIQPGQWLHLSSRMCVAHRKEVIQKLKTGKFNCISTQIVEAGIDIDYPVVFTDECPFDSLIQRGGRCNREGKLPSMGKVFIIPCNNYPSKDYAQLAIITSNYVLGHKGFKTDELIGLLSKYFSVKNSNISHEIQDLRKNLMFKDVADKFKVIDKGMPTVLCEWGNGIQLINQFKNYPTLT